MASTLDQANEQLRSGQYAEAVDLYKRALQEHTELIRAIQSNLELAQNKLYLELAHDSLFESATELPSLSAQPGLPTDLDSALDSLLEDATEFSLPPAQHDLSTNWLSHETLQNNSNASRIVLGGMVLGYPEKGNNSIPPRIVECARLYERIAQIHDSRGLNLIVDEALIRPLSFPLNPSAFVHAFGTKNIRLDSIWDANSRDLRLRVEKELPFNRPQALRAYQYDSSVGGGLVLVGACVLQGEAWELNEVTLINPYLPVLLTLAAPEGYLTDAALIPYPSLLPGGIHEHECYVGNTANDPKSLAQALLQEHLLALQHGWAMGQLQVDIREAIGTEAILSSDFKEWLWSIFSLCVKPWNPPKLSQALSEYWQEVFETSPFMRTAEKTGRHSAREREGRTLLCPPRAIPSLRALTISRSSGELEQTCGISEFLLVQQGSSTQRWRLRWPEIAPNRERAIEQDGAIHVPRVLLGKDDNTKRVLENAAGVSAILIGETVAPTGIQLIMPTAPDFVEMSRQSTTTCLVDVVVTAVDLSAEVFSAFLESLSLQRAFSLRQIVVILPTSGDQKAFDAILQRNHAGRYLLLPAREGEYYKQRVQRATNAIKRQPEDAYMLFVNQPMVIHDPRTLAALVKALTIPKAVTTSALLIGSVGSNPKAETTIRSRGVFPLLAQGEIEFEWRKDNLAIAMPRTTLPVASHGDALFVIKAKDWKKFGGFAGVEAEDESAAHEYAAKLASDNKLHLLVPHVTVELHDAAADHGLSETGWKPATNLNGRSNAVCIEVLHS